MTETVPGLSRASWRELFGASLLVAAAFCVLMLLTALFGRLPLRDPDGFLGPSYIRLPLIAAAMILLDIVPRAGLRLFRGRSPLAALKDVVRERWPLSRLAVVSAGLGLFYVCYVSYRNLKSFLPFVREDLHDEWLLRNDAWFALGGHPGDQLHELLGTGISADVLSFVYMVFLPFVPLSLAAAMVWGHDLVRGAWYVTALSLNWVLGTLSYYLLPALGPIYVQSYRFADLPVTAVSKLQDALWSNRVEVLADPFATSSVHGIAAFASLHTSITLTAALFVTLNRMNQLVQWAAWTFFALTAVATVYFGWHYVLDLVAGIVIAVLAVGLGRLLVGRRIPLGDRGARSDQVVDAAPTV